jgi:hypothetical protein
MKYEITEVSTSEIKVVYEDSSWAKINVHAEEDLNTIRRAIASFAPKTNFAKTSDCPVKVGDTGDTSETNPQTYTYGVARQIHYPTMGDQLDALHWAREGDSSHQTTIDTKIKDTKTKWPKTLADMNQAEYDAKVKELYG